MAFSRVAHDLVSVVAAAVLIALLYFLYCAEASGSAEYYRLAWYALLAAVFLMEARVRLGYRTPRGTLFYAHLVFAVPFFLALGVLAFLARPLWLVILGDALLAGLAVVGATLFYRGIRASRSGGSGILGQ